MSDEKVALDADEVGEALHTALRKCCDSKESSYAWNIVHLLDESWSAFCERVVEADARTGDQLRAVFEAMEWLPDPNTKTRESLYARQVFRISLGEMDEGDWEGFAAYLSEW